MWAVWFLVGLLGVGTVLAVWVWVQVFLCLKPEPGPVICPRCHSALQVWLDDDGAYRCHRLGCERARREDGEPGLARKRASQGSPVLGEDGI
jgi:hypothetical protein